ncbi:alpha/beta hydrolase-fold protein [Nonomuraea sp. NPDC000554]|uniref:alpha/beta hydrolase n=1 Tax=Nonomuraea sp. NPDC000554 TaxID=3154259 RepID=UPI00331C0B8C
MRRSRRWSLSALAGMLLAAGAVVAPATAARAETCSTSLPHPDGFGITCLRVDRHPQADGSELRDITMTSTAIFQASGGTPAIDPLARQITVRIYLPGGYDPARSARYRSLYLLNGGGDSYDEWTTKADLVSLIASVPGHPYDGIVVMPTGGLSGWYADWAGRTDGYFAPKWETYHIAQLIPWVDANFNTVADRSGRGLAGLSMGGYGTLRYAAAHPDVFSVIGAFSPGIDVRAKPAQGTLSDSMWQAGASIAPLDLLNGKFRVNKYDANGLPVLDQDQQRLYRLDTLFGAHTTSVVDGRTVYDWPSANPATLVTQGRYAPFSGRLGLYAGGCAALPPDPDHPGQVLYGDGDDPAPPECAYSTTSPANTEATGVNEAILGSYASAFDATLTGLGVAHRYCYGTGGHDWGSWPADLVDFLQYAYGTAPPRCPNA